MTDVREAHLISAAGIEGAHTTTTLPRSDVDEALRLDGRAELILEVVRANEPGRTLRVAWDRADLERVLRETDGDEVELRFSRDELEAALDDDVEAHGLRQRAAVLAVAVAAAGSVAGPAAARTLDTGGGSTPVVHGMTAKQIWATAPTALKRIQARIDAARARRLEQAAPYTPTAAAEPSDGGSGLSAPSPGEAGALAGGAALLIASAGFAARARNQQHRLT
jgi:hypothetical protein